MNAREQILATLRAANAASAPPLPPLAARRDLPVPERVTRFTAMLTRVGGTVERCADLAAALLRGGDLLREARAIAVSDASELRSLAANLPTAARLLPHDAPRDELLAADAGVTMAQWGIAETGTLVLVSASEQHRLASLLPPLHVALLPVDRLLGGFDEALAELRGPAGRSPAARTITFVTGPSRTADIELELVVGVHGPKALHVLLIGPG